MKLDPDQIVCHCFGYTYNDILSDTVTVRLLGISLSSLQEGDDMQPSLFEDNRKKEQLTKAMDAVNNRFGDMKVTFGSLLDAEEKGSPVINPAWRPDGFGNVGVEC